MANLFDTTRPKPKPVEPAAPTASPAPVRRDLMGNAIKTKAAPPPKADSGVISDKAAQELTAAATEAAEKIKAGAGKLAGELTSRAKSTWVPAVKTKVSQVTFPQVPKKTMALGVGVLLAAAIGGYAWHVHSSAPIAAAPKATPAPTATVIKAPEVEASIPANVSVPKPAPVVTAPKPMAPVAIVPPKPTPVTPPQVVVPKPIVPPVAPVPVPPAVVAQAKPPVVKPAPKPHPVAQDKADDKLLQDDSAKLDAYFKQH